MNNWSIIGFIIGVALLLSGWIRYFLLWYDPSQAFMFIGVGVCVISISWLFNSYRRLEYKLTSLQEFIQDNLVKRRSIS